MVSFLHNPSISPAFEEAGDSFFQAEESEQGTRVILFFPCFFPYGIDALQPVEKRGSAVYPWFQPLRNEGDFKCGAIERRSEREESASFT